MKRTKLIFNLSFFVLLALVISYQVVYSKSKETKLIIDLPEEVGEISHTFYEPDNMACYIQNDTLFVSFRPVSFEQCTERLGGMTDTNCEACEHLLK